MAKLAARIGALTGAVQFFVAEGIAARPAGARGESLHIRRRAFSTPPQAEVALLSASS